MATLAPSPTRSDTRFDGLAFGACGIAILSALTDVKIFDVQVMEIFALLYLPVFIGIMRLRLEFLPPFAIMGRRLLFFFLFMLLGSIASLRLDFFPPGDFGILKMPPYASFIRFVQVILAFSTFFLVGLVGARSRGSADLVLRAFIFGGVASSVWGIVSFVGHLGGVELPGAYVYGGVLRARGFFVEGGPFGVYLMGILAALLARYFYVRTLSLRSLAIQVLIVFVAFALAQSKAAFFVAAVLTAVYMYSSGRVGLVLATLVVLTPVAVAGNFTDRLSTYYEDSAKLEQEIRLRPEDRNYAMGRLSGSILLPRMTQAHPILGIGIGNYSLVRNDPEILRGMPQVREWDLHGLGLLGYMAELGVPLTAYLLFLYLYPLLLARRLPGRDVPWLVMLAAFPVAATLFGAQITFAYPWVVGGLVVAFVCARFSGAPPRQRG